MSDSGPSIEKWRPFKNAGKRGSPAAAWVMLGLGASVGIFVTCMASSLLVQVPAGLITCAFFYCGFRTIQG